MSTRPASVSPLGRLAAAGASLPGGAAWSAWRQEALARLLDRGLPSPRDDAWKYTNLRLIERRDLSPAPVRPVDAAVLGSLPALDGPRLVFVDGRFQPSLSAARLPDGISFVRFASTLDTSAPAALGPELAGDAALVDERVRLLNACLASDGPTVSVAPGATAPQPLQVVHVATGGGAYPRTRLDLGAGATLALVELHVGVADADAFVAAASDITIGPGARLDHTSFQVAGTRTILLDDVRVRVAADASYRHHLVAIGAQLARLDLRVALEGRGGNVALDGAFVVDGSREHHVRTLVEHRLAHTTSDQLYRGVASGRGRGSYDGKVIVAAGAAKTESRQSSRNLLIGRDATIDARPQLEINADDVKCGHGSTVGTLDEQMLFYLLSRGLDRDAARALLTYAFLGDVLRRLAPEPLRRAAESRVLGRLPGADLVREFVA